MEGPPLSRSPRWSRSRAGPGAQRDFLQLAAVNAWARPAMRANLKRTLNTLNSKDLLHLQGERYLLTHLGEEDFEKRRLLEPQ
jgi:hypothetical protein